MKRTVADLKIGESGIIDEILGESEYVNRLLEMGFTKGTPVKLNKKAPFGDPLELQVRDYVLAIRKSSASHIYIK